MGNPSSYRGWVAISLLLLAPCTASAAGMGRLNVLSSLGQPLLAEIDLVSVHRDEVATLGVRLAPSAAYREANMQYTAAEAGLRVAIDKRADGRLYIRVNSQRPINEPFVNLLVELSWATGRLTREYTALLDPPGYTPAETVTVVPAAPAVATPAPPSQPPAVAVTPSPAPRKAPAASEYTVKRGDTLSKIARSVKPEGISVEQMLVALYRANPDAFIGNNMNRLRAGATLSIPEGDQLAAVNSTEARRELRLHTTDWNRYRQRVADTARASAGGKLAPRAAKARVQDKGGEGNPGKDVLRLSSGEPKKGDSSVERVQALEEELIARQRELSEANKRIQELERAAREAKSTK